MEVPLFLPFQTWGGKCFSAREGEACMAMESLQPCLLLGLAAGQREPKERKASPPPLVGKEVDLGVHIQGDCGSKANYPQIGRGGIFRQGGLDVQRSLFMARTSLRRDRGKDEDEDEDEDDGKDKGKEKEEEEEEAEEADLGGTLCMSDMGIKPRAATSIAMDLRHNTTIESLDISRNVIGDAGATALAAALQANSTLETLDMGSNGVSSHGAGCIGAALMRNTSLKVLELSFNGIGDQGASLFSGAIPHSKGLEHIGLGFNGIMPSGAAWIAEALEKKNSLLSMELAYNQVGDEGAMHLAAAVGGGGTNLERLGLSSNGIGDQGAISLAKALEEPACNLLSLSLANNSITDLGATHLAKALLVNTRLTSLRVEENPLTEAGIAAIGAARSSESIRELPAEHKMALAMSTHTRLGSGTELQAAGQDILRMIVDMCQTRRPRSIVFHAKILFPEEDLPA